MSNRRNARQSKKAFVGDSFQNFTAHVGRGTGNQNDASHYGFNPVTRNRMQMDWVYRGSWIAGRVVDAVAQDMTREGMTITTSDDPSKVAEYEKELGRLHLWKSIRDTLKWARLYGGAIAFMMIDGQNPATPLKLDRIRPGQFKGLMPLDRWVITPSLNDLVEDYGPHFGKPRFYDTITDTGGMPRLKIHYSRVIRIEGVELPYWQKISENLWGQSVVERMWDRLLAYDSATAGISQMAYKAHLRVLSVEGLREIIGGTTSAMRGLLANINMIRAMQTNEGLTLLDTRDKFETHQYSFGGLDAILAQFGEQLAGAVEIPLVRLFGQSPSGFSTGESDIRAYYDSIKQQQVSLLGDGIDTIYRLAYISKWGKEPPKEFTLDFTSLWQMSDTEKSQVTNTVTAAVGEAFSAQIISKATALKELKQLSLTTGTFSNIDDEDIERAESLPDPTPEALGLVIPKPEPGMLPGAAGKPGAPKPATFKKPGAKPPGRPARGKEVGGVKGPKTKAPAKGKDQAFFEAFDTESMPNLTGLRHGAGHGFKNPTEKRLASGLFTLFHRKPKTERPAPPDDDDGGEEDDEGIEGEEAAESLTTDKDQSRSARAKAEARVPAGQGKKSGEFTATKGKGGWTTTGKTFNRVGGEQYTIKKGKLKGQTRTKYEKGNFKWVGGTAEEHKFLHSIYVPPGLTDVRINPDRLNAELGKVAVGTDRRGEPQPVYLPGVREATSDVEKFQRVRDFHKVRGKLLAKAASDMFNADLPLKTQDAAAVTYLMGVSGQRPGSNKEVKAAKKAYGVSTLEGRHITIEAGAVKFNYPGKHGVRQKHTVTDPAFVRLMRETQPEARERIFGASDNDVRKYVAEHAGEQFIPYDLRTWIATETAYREVKAMPVPRTETEHKDGLKKVATKVSKLLGNEPGEALKSYIDPVVWKTWAATKPKPKPKKKKKTAKDWIVSFFQ